MKRRRVLIGGGTGIVTLVTGCIGDSDGTTGGGESPTDTPANSGNEGGTPGRNESSDDDGVPNDERRTPGGNGSSDERTPGGNESSERGADDGDGSGEEDDEGDTDGRDREERALRIPLHISWILSDESTGGKLTVMYTGGGVLTPENTGRLVVVGDSFERVWYDGDGEVAYGNSVEITGDLVGEEVRVVWSPPDAETSRLIERYTVPDSSSRGSDDERRLRFSAPPTDPANMMAAQYEPIEERLERIVGRVDEVLVEYSPGYGATLEFLESGDSHVADLESYSTGVGIRNDQCEILLQRHAYGSWTYSSVVVTTEEMQQEHDLEDLSDLKGKPVAFAEPLSAAGSLFPLKMLSEAGLSIPDRPGTPAGSGFKPTWTNHSDAFELVQQGDVAACGVGRFAAVRDLEEGEERPRSYQEGVVELDVVDIPRPPIVGSPDLDPEIRDQVVEAFVDAGDRLFQGADRRDGTADDLWYEDVREADESTYQPMVDMVEELGYGVELF